MSAPARTPEQLEQLAREAAERLHDAGTEEVLAWAAEEFGAGHPSEHTRGGAAVACSMAGDTILPHLVSRHIGGVDVLFLDTGYHFAETLATRDELAWALPINVIDLRAELSVAEQDEKFGPKLFERDPGRCCQMRKVEPLDTRLAGYEAWFTGVRREDNALRANAGLIEWDARHQMVKINPIAAWSFDDVLDYADRHVVPVNPLLADGYPSIGCAPCTRRVAPGEDPRAGRWAGLAKTECGIHL